MVADPRSSGGEIPAALAESLLEVSDRFRASLDASVQATVADLEPFLESIQRDAAAAAARLAERLASLEPWHLPENLRPMGWAFKMRLAAELMRDKGIPLAWAPDAETARLVMDASEASARKAIFADRRAEIAEHCSVAVAPLESDQVAELVPLAAAAIAALRDGHYAASQALATTVLDTAVMWWLPHKEDRGDAISNARKLTEPWLFDDAFSLLQVAGVYQRFEPVDVAGRSVFNRHRTVHDVNGAQYDVANAVIAVCHMTSMLVGIDRMDDRGWLELLEEDRVDVSAVEADSIPEGPGVELWLRDGRPVYLGATGNLRSRITTHLATGLSTKSSALRRNVAELICGVEPKRMHVTVEQSRLVRAWLEECELLWLELTDDAEAKAWKSLLLSRRRPLLNKRG